MSQGNDRIELSLPFKAEYVSVARLTASGIASRIGFDIDAVEDIKVVVGEVCNRIIELGSEIAQSYKICFEKCDNHLAIRFECEDPDLKCIFRDEENELGLSIIHALMDNVEVCSDNGYVFSMLKEIKGDH